MISVAIPTQDINSPSVLLRGFFLQFAATVSSLTKQVLLREDDAWPPLGLSLTHSMCDKPCSPAA